MLLAAYGIGLGVRKIRSAGEVAQDPPEQALVKAVSEPVTKDAFALLDAGLGVVIPAGTQDNLMDYWDTLSDEQKMEYWWSTLSDEEKTEYSSAASDEEMMDYWNDLSDEEKAQAQEQWDSMSDEERKHALAQLVAVLGVEITPEMSDNIMDYYNALSDEEKAQAQEEWDSMSDEQKRQALESWTGGGPAGNAVSGQVTNDTFEQLGAGLGVEMTPGMQNNLMQYYNALSDVEKAQSQENWESMSNEQKKQALESWRGM